MKKFALGLLVMSALTVAVALAAGPYLDFLPPLCPFRAITGRRCVFCGMSHAVAFAVRGDFSRASMAHPGWFVVLPLFLIAVAIASARRGRIPWIFVAGAVIGTLWTAL